jgi:hypothetical protein
MNEDSKKANDISYICEGSCNAQITQKQYDEGLTKCGAKSCNMHGKPFTRLKK